MEVKIGASRSGFGIPEGLTIKDGDRFDGQLILCFEEEGTEWDVDVHELSAALCSFLERERQKQEFGEHLSRWMKGTR